MLHCKRKNCQYASAMTGVNERGAMFCDYMGWTGKRRGVYGEDVKHCDKFTPRKLKRRPSHLAIGNREWIIENARARGVKCSEENAE